MAGNTSRYGCGNPIYLRHFHIKVKIAVQFYGNLFSFIRNGIFILSQQ